MPVSLVPSFDPCQSLREHARARPESLACVSRFRLVSYRKLSNRIERAAARLHGEWGVRPGDLVAYLGCGHPDALVLYFGLARCGARLLPLEHAQLQAAHGRIVSELGVRLTLHDDGMQPPDSPAHSLSELIGMATPHRPVLPAPDPRTVSLVRIESMAAGPLHVGMCSMAQSVGPEAVSDCEVRGALFDPGVLPMVLSVLAAGGTLRLA
jgi:acyl-CoA synthetase (AMP-forming)/AMP-acid ligase II